MSHSGPDAPRSICVTRDAGLRRTLRRTLSAAGAEVEFVDDPKRAEARAAHLLFVDGEAWQAAKPGELFELLADGGKLVILGDTLADDELVLLLGNNQLDHVIGPRDAPDETEVLVTSVKLLSGDLFGLEKYLAWGGKVHEAWVSSYDDKRRALDEVGAQARQLGARRSVVSRIESATDELLMNALYDAPAARDGTSPMARIDTTGRDDASFSDEPALLRYGCDGRHFAISVQDSYGELHKRAILEHLMRARNEQGRPAPSAEGAERGAGLGLYFVVSSATRFIVNIAHKQRTEVICLFDLDQSGKNAPPCARSIHIFTSGDGNGDGGEESDAA